MRGTYSFSRAEQWPGSVNYRLPVARSGVLLAVLFAVGVGLGLVASRPWASPTAQSVTETDYVGIVAQLFAQDHNTTIARERLAVYGSPAAMLGRALQAAQSGDPRNAADRTAIQALAQALSPSAADPIAATSAESSAAPAAAATTPDEHVSWVGPLAAFLLAFALGALVLLRTAGLTVPLPALPARRASGARPREAREDLAVNGRQTYSPATLSRSQAVEVTTRPREEEREVVRPREPSRAAEPREASRARTTVRRPARLLTFQSCYSDGDEQFDEIYPITDPTTGTLVAACGLNAALKCDPTGAGRYVAFTAWLQDYANGDELSAIGLVAPGASEAARPAIDDWVRSGQIDGVLSVQTGTTTEIQTGDHRATVTVLDVAFGDEPAGASKYFDQLTVRFEIVPKVHLAEG
jgi:hypothetical protein